MRHQSVFLPAMLALAAVLSGAGPREGRIIATVANHTTHVTTPLTKADIDDSGAMQVVDITPLRGESEIYIVIDDAATYDFGDKLTEIRAFIGELTPDIAVGVAFIRDGQLEIARTPLKERDAAIAALRAPSGSKPANPYCALSALINGWESRAGRREIVIITSGIDYTGGTGCATGENAIADAQRAGVVVYAIYHPVAGYEDEEWSRVDNGKISLTHVCYETAGEAYSISHGPAESMRPFFLDISEHLANQYSIKVKVASGPAPGFEFVFLFSRRKGMELMLPARVWMAPPKK